MVLLAIACAPVPEAELERRLDPDGDGVTLDDDCDDRDPDLTSVERWYVDQDADGHGDPRTEVLACGAPDGRVAEGDDCDDQDAGVFPGHPESCDGVDEDCDGAVDEGAADPTPIYRDRDRDGVGGDRIGTACAPGPAESAVAGDCDDEDAAVHPGARERCGNGVDDDCSGTWAGCALDPEVTVGTATPVWIGGAGDKLGWAVAAVSDEDGDGAGIVWMGALGDGPLNLYGGGLYGYHRPVGPVSVNVLVDATPLARADAGPGTWLGAAIAVVPDTNGDGLSEVAVGAPRDPAAPGGVVSGILGREVPFSGVLGLASTELWLDGWAVGEFLAAGELDGDPGGELVLGSASGDGAAFLVDWPGESGAGVPFASVLGSPGLRVDGPVASVGDVDGDGLGDAVVAIGGSGVAWIPGGSTGARAAEDLERIDAGPVGGPAVASGCGDLDGDGLGDVVLGMPYASASALEAGRVVVIAGMRAGDLDDVARLVVDGVEVAGQLGRSVAPLSDADGDGTPEVAAGAAGAVWVLDGSAVGPQDASTATLSRVTAATADGSFGASLAGGVDLDADGVPDLLIGAPQDGTGGAGAGAVYLLSGVSE